MPSGCLLSGSSARSRHALIGRTPSPKEKFACLTCTKDLRHRRLVRWLTPRRAAHASRGGAAAARSRFAPCPDRRPADGTTASRPLLRHAAQSGASTRPRRRAIGRGRRLSDDHRPRQPGVASRRCQRAAGRLSRSRYRRGQGDDLRPLPSRAPQPAAGAVSQPRQRRRTRAQPDRQGRDGLRGSVFDVGADVHLPSSSGRRHSLLQGHRCPGGQRPAPPPRAHPFDRAPVQPPLQPPERRVFPSPPRSSATLRRCWEPMARR